MELDSFLSLEGLTLGGVIASVIGAFVWVVVGFLTLICVRWFLGYFRVVRVQSLMRRIVLSFFPRYFALGLFSFIVAIVIWNLIQGLIEIGGRAEFVVIFTLSTLLLHVAWRDWSFASIGFGAAEKSVASGTDYESSLRLCRKSISFLGTGAYKLTNNREFELAVARCMANGGSVRILMSRPDVPPLRRAEKMADVDPGDYSTKVRSTLKRLRALKRDREYPIEVRFHNKDNATRMQEFRMMFVDDERLFLSFNLYGHGDGSDIPQVVLTRNARANSLKSFFHPFSESFERVWRSSAKWNFDDYLED